MTILLYMALESLQTLYNFTLPVIKQSYSLFWGEKTLHRTMYSELCCF